MYIFVYCHWQCIKVPNWTLSKTKYLGPFKFCPFDRLNIESHFKMCFLELPGKLTIFHTFFSQLYVLCELLGSAAAHFSIRMFGFSLGISIYQGYQSFLCHHVKYFFSACHLLYNFVYGSLEVWKFKNFVIQPIVIFLYYFFCCFMLGKLYPIQ